jgi:O-antigen/teichoic acid export membrane protein
MAQVIPFLFAPVIARLFDADAFAVFGTMLAVFNILKVVVAGRYEQAIVLPREPVRASDLSKGALLIAAMTSLFFGTVLWATGDLLERGSGLTGLHLLAWPVTGLVFLGGIQLVLLQWLLRNRAFKAIAAQKVLQAVAITAFTLLLGWMTWRNGLVIGYVVGWAVYTIATFWVVLRRYPLGPAWEWPRVRSVLHEYRSWPLHNAWPAVLNAVASGMAVFYMVSFFSPRVAGEHNFARQYLLVPLSMISVALGQVLFERSATAVRERRPIGPDLRRVTGVLLLLAVLLSLGVTVLGAPVFAWLFGEPWRYAGHIAGILIWGYAAQFVASPLGSQLIAMGKVKAAMAFPVFFAALLAVLPFFKHVGPLRFMALLSGTEVLAYGAYAAWVWHHVRSYERGLRSSGP